MHIVRYRRADDATPRVGVRTDGVVRSLPVASVAALLGARLADIQALTSEPGDVVDDARLLAPVDGATEVWAAGVTYLRSREARMEESSEADIYGRVYDAARPELFFKSAAWRVVVDGEPVAIRADSGLDVPEPELALVVNRFGEIAGYLVSNDMSSRSIEGENPLYLPQAKVYAGACALSAGIRPAWEVDGSDLPVAVRVTRDGVAVWTGTTSTARLKRPFADLVDYLFKADNFPAGAVLSTGTGLAPALDFTLREGDVVTITIDEVGELTNPVVVGREHFEFLRP
ncbi:2-dehydro-3-deoxy-D-arabinonate dehydratase [Asanoa ferruginea]|uniref:2-dehydro-3-deoxy-D-arabinonate dehydratase n=1 Tax=Asanoa ferruginea TaxID=53367 RepID=A0A3D9ZW26_9ACTN|nr:fumarylacetoacetate hydrolase family protein [Asanoa ferruginea]REG00304.1 2-dehydro-3-deoxy-D-arabinonate dehydratase [Asanoa ferruginea]GIF52147.1 fumarylacetoacetate (FAA) hydrolase [Asanoa ferruginea]